MSIQLTIGRDSCGKLHTIDLMALPNLFISYSEEEQMPQMLQGILQDINKDDCQARVALFSGQSILEDLLTLNSVQLHLPFTKPHSEIDTIRNIDAFIAELLNEIRMRKKRANSNKRIKVFEIPIIVVIDNIFEVITSRHKKTALSFIQLLVDGSAYAMHMITFSSGIYQNLLNQLVAVSPVEEKKMLKHNLSVPITGPLAAQLIINPDGLIFFKARNTAEFLLLYAR